MANHIERFTYSSPGSLHLLHLFYTVAIYMLLQRAHNKHDIPDLRVNTGQGMGYNRYIVKGGHTDKDTPYF